MSENREVGTSNYFSMLRTQKSPRYGQECSFLYYQRGVPMGVEMENKNLGLLLIAAFLGAGIWYATTQTPEAKAKRELAVAKAKLELLAEEVRAERMAKAQAHYDSLADQESCIDIVAEYLQGKKEKWEEIQTEYVPGTYGYDLNEWNCSAWYGSRSLLDKEIIEEEFLTARKCRSRITKEDAYNAAVRVDWNPERECGKLACWGALCK